MFKCVTRRQQRRTGPSRLYGDIRGWDARTGTLLWSFHTVPRAGEPGVETWEGESWKNRSGTNVWSFFTIDVERGIVYAPIGSPTSDYYGGDRKGANLYGNSVVALDVMTGKQVHRQLGIRHLGLRHAGGADLIDVKRNGARFGVGVITDGPAFLRPRHGEPVSASKTRPVPPEHRPGEATWPTQPLTVSLSRSHGTRRSAKNYTRSRPSTQRTV